MRIHRLRLSAGASLATIAALFGSSEAHAQAFQGTPTTTLGNVSYNRTTPGIETITVDSAQATINWAPSDTAIGGGDIVFLPNGNAATYAAGTGAPGGQYTVLNRIIPVDPSRRILLDGQLNSAAGGSIWFYAPGGLLLGNNARFNVGSLLLTAGDPVTDVNGFFMNSGAYSLATAAGNTAGVAIASGAQVNATNANSYVVAFAPRIDQSGTINVNGSAALVAAEAADFSFGAGLFDIAVTRGTDAGGVAFNHSGTTTGPASSSPTDYHRIYLVAVPKNVALTMAIIGTGQLGFDIAGAADVIGNTVVLSAGQNVGSFANGDPIAEQPASPAAATISASAVSYTSNVYARAATDAFFNSSAISPTSFASNVSIKAANTAQLGAANNATLSIAGNVLVSAVASSTHTLGANRTGGNANFFNSVGSTTNVGGSVTVDASGFGDLNSSGSGSGGTGTGGSAGLNVQGGNFTIGGNATVLADGYGGGNSNGTGSTGNAVGGSALIFSHDDTASGLQGLLTIHGFAVASADGDVAGAATSAGIDGGNATAGQATIISNFGGSMVIDGAASAFGRAFGGANLGGGDLIGGNATGSTMSQINAQTAGATLSIGGNATVDSAAFAGDSSAVGGAGGTGTGGYAHLEGSPGATMTVAGTVLVRGRGQGGAGTNGANGGAGIGGQASSQGGTAGGVTRFTGTGATITYNAQGVGGDGASGGAGTGGVSTVSVGGASGLIGVAGASWLQTAAGVGGNASTGAGGAGAGGTVNLTSGAGVGGSTITMSANTQLRSNGIGGVGMAGAGGAGTGGIVNVTAQNGGATLTFPGTLDLQSTGTGGASSGGAGGAGTGNQVSTTVTNATLTVSGATTIAALGIGGDAGALSGAAGGTATGGFISTQALSGTLTGGDAVISLAALTQTATAAGGAGGSGTAGGAGGRGGDATGGNASFIAQSRNGKMTATAVTSDASVTGGAGGAGGSGATGGFGGRGGDATGGFVFNHGTSSGPVGPVMAGYNRTNSMTLSASATGGTGGAGGSGTTGGAGGRGGDSKGGSAGLIARGSEVTTGALVANANTVGGNGGAGSGGATDGDGGNASALTGAGAGVLATQQFNNGSPATVTIASVTASANATGGSSGTGGGGSATAGEAYVRLEESPSPAVQAANVGTLNVTGAANLTANGTGGSTNTGTAGAGTGGVAHFVSVSGTLTLNNAAAATATGNGGTIATGGIGGTGTGGTAEILVDGGGRMDVTNRFDGRADGIGSAGLTGTGGAGRGGAANAQVASGGGTLNLNAGTQLSTTGTGGTGAAGGGSGTGGTSFAGTQGAGNFTDATGTAINAFGIGGASTGGAGGAATGGNGTTGSVAGTVRFNGTVGISAAATGGNSGAGTGGAATGGQANLRSFGGTTIVASTATLVTNALAGSSSAGNGGAGTGGSATIGTLTNAGIFTVNGATNVQSSGNGGAGAGAGSVGGAGTGGLAQALGFGAATFNNTVFLGTTSIGGSGATGGAGAGGTARAVAVESTTAGGSLTITGATNLGSNGTGGAALAGSGGAGGKGTGGLTQLSTSATNFNSQLTAAAASEVASGSGGAGGAGAAGQAGGRGGDGAGGTVSSGSTSSAGTINVGALSQFSLGRGGVGGAGGSGAVGGAGGDGVSGTVGAGNNTNGASALTGSFTWASVTGFATGQGGNGGAGGGGANGGAGGSGTGGLATSGINGGTMTVTGLLDMRAGGTGGNGGAGAVQGAGGAGIGGNAGAGVGAHFVSGGTSNLNGATLVALANGVAGTGSTPGATTAGKADAIASFGNVRFTDITIQAAGANAPTVPSPFGFIASGLGAFDGTLTATGNAYVGFDITGTNPFGLGSDAAVATGNGSINIGGDLYVQTRRDIVASLTGAQGTAPGTVTTGGGSVFDAGGSIAMPSKVIAHGSDASFDAGTTITLGDVRSDADVTINGDGIVVTGNLSAGDSIQVDAQQSRQFADPLSPYTVTTGNLDAGINTGSTNQNAGYQVGITGNAGVATGTIGANGNVGLAAFGGSVTAGAIATTKTVGILAANAVTTGAVATGTTANDYFYVSNPSIFASDPNLDASGPPSGFDFTPFVTLTPQPIAGNLTINGGVTTGNFKVATAGTLTVTGAINVSSAYFAQANALALGDLTAGGAIDLVAATTIAAGNVRGATDVTVAANGDIVLGNVSAGDSISINPATGHLPSTTASVRAGNLDAGLVNPSTDPQAGYQIGVRAPGNVSIGSAGARGNIGLASTAGSVTSGAITTQKSVLLLASNAAATGAITTASTGFAYIGNPSAYTAPQLAALNPIGPPSGFDFAPLVANAPVRIGGSVQIGGAVDTGSFAAASSGSFSAGAIKAVQSINVNSGALASFAGLADSPTITVRSGDIAIAQGGALGTSGTSLINLQIDPSAQTISIGDSTAQQGWTLDNGEAGRLHARRTLIQTLSTQPPVVKIGTLRLAGSAGTNPNLIGQNASFEVQTPRSISVGGAMSVAGAAATDAIKLTAGQRIDVLTDTGGALTLSDASGTVAGVLDLTALNLFAGTLSLAQLLTDNPSFAGRDAALAAVPASPNLAGSIGANTIRVTSGGTVLIQNSGSATQRAGFTAGSGGFTVTAQSTTQQTTATPVDVVINGRAFDSAGMAYFNQHTVDRVTFTPSSSGTGFTTTSSVNGCVIDGVCRIGGYYGTPEEDPVLATVQDIATNSEEITDEDKRKVEAAEQAAAEQVPAVRIERLISTRPVIADPVVEEPITSGGNPSLWIGAAEPLTPGPGETP